VILTVYETEAHMVYVSNANTFVCLSSYTHGTFKSGCWSTTKRGNATSTCSTRILSASNAA